MPIVEIQSGDAGPNISKACQRCKTVDVVQANGLTLGSEHMAEAITLPPCSKCGAVETLIRTTDASVPTQFAGHRKLVNALANYLTGRGSVNTSALAPDTKLAPAAPVGELYGKVYQLIAVPVAPANPLVMARAAMAAAQKALEAAEAAAKK